MLTVADDTSMLFARDDYFTVVMPRHPGPKRAIMVFKRSLNAVIALREAVYDTRSDSLKMVCRPISIPLSNINIAAMRFRSQFR